MKTAHTPGPWRAACTCNSATHRHPAILSDGGQVAIATFQGSEPATDANARLIASAPALLEALQALADDYESFMADRLPPGQAHLAAQLSVLVEARAAIAAATLGAA